jgi:hypothetical protein
MTFVPPEEISSAHLERYWSVFAVSESEDAMIKVWDSKRLLPFVAQHAPATLVEDLYVRVPSLDERGLRPVFDALRRTDPLGTVRLLPS